MQLLRVPWSLFSQKTKTFFLRSFLNTVVKTATELTSTPSNLFSLKLIFEHWKSESQRDVSVTRISYRLFSMVFSRLYVDSVIS